MASEEEESQSKNIMSEEGMTEEETSKSHTLVEDEDDNSLPASERVNQEAKPSPRSQFQSGRVIISNEDFETMSKDDIIKVWNEQNSYIDKIENEMLHFEGEAENLKDTLEKLKAEFNELCQQERLLKRAIDKKDQDLHELSCQINELKESQVPTIQSLKNTVLDPSIHLLIMKLRQELAATKTKLEDTQNELSAWQFTPDSNTGKRLMAKCRLLYQENEELGKSISSGRLARLEGELAIQKSFCKEVKKSQEELDEFLQELDEDVEGMQGTIYILQQQLKQTTENLAIAQKENANLRRGILSQENEKAVEPQIDSSNDKETEEVSNTIEEDEEEITAEDELQTDDNMQEQEQDQEEDDSNTEDREMEMEEVEEDDEPEAKRARLEEDSNSTDI